MAKAGDAYRELVGTVMATLDPESAVKTEQWITGPDGERDMDVEVRGTLNGVRHEPRWSYHGQSLMVGGLKFHFTVEKDWVAQTVKTDVSLGYYDHLKERVVVPGRQWYALGLIDNEAWEETDKVWEHGEMEPNTFRLDITMSRSNLPNSPGPPPKVDELITESRVDVE